MSGIVTSRQIRRPGRLRDRMMRARRGGRERGAGGESLELITIAIALIVVILIGIAAARAVKSSGQVNQAANAGARAASLTRTPAAARSAAHDAVEVSMADSGMSCENLDVAVDTAGFGAGVGQPASVSVTVRCVVQWGDLGIPLWPSSKTYTGTAASPLDSYRERG